MGCKCKRAKKMQKALIGDSSVVKKNNIILIAVFKIILMVITFSLAIVLFPFGLLFVIYKAIFKGSTAIKVPKYLVKRI